MRGDFFVKSLLFSLICAIICRVLEIFDKGGVI